MQSTPVDVVLYIRPVHVGRLFCMSTKVMLARPCILVAMCFGHKFDYCFEIYCMDSLGQRNMIVDFVL